MTTTINILVLGAEGTGKSLLLKRLHYLVANGLAETFDDIPSTVPTVGNNIININLNKKNYEVREVGGSLAPIWKNYYKDSQAVIYVINKSNHLQISASCMLLLTVLADEKLTNKPILILFNKTDFDCHFNMVELRKIYRLDEIQQNSNQNITVKEISCVDKNGFQDIFTWLQTLNVHKSTS